MDSLLTQGIGIPKLGLGTNRMFDDVCRSAVESALALGYRHIDTAEMYANETAVGQAIRASGLPRSELHITTKLSPEHTTDAGTIRNALENSLERLQTAFVDLYLLHWPTPGMNLGAIMEALMMMKDNGFTRAIGVCNFTIPLLKTALDEIGAPLACNQIEYHVLLGQSPVRAFLRSRGLPLVAFCPLAQGQLSREPTLLAVARKHQVAAEQIALKWLLDQHGVIAIPKARHPNNQKANLEALDIQLDAEDQHLIEALPKGLRIVSPPFAPAWD